MFSHMAVMYAYALYQRGLAAEGFRVLDAIYQQAVDFAASGCTGHPGVLQPARAGHVPYLTGLGELVPADLHYPGVRRFGQARRSGFDSPAAIVPIRRQWKRRRAHPFRRAHPGYRLSQPATAGVWRLLHPRHPHRWPTAGGDWQAQALISRSSITAWRPAKRTPLISTWIKSPCHAERSEASLLPCAEEGFFATLRTTSPE